MDEHRIFSRLSLPTEYLFIGVFLIGLLLRVLFPELRLLHHDEAIHAWYTYTLITDGTYLYDPTYHGPLLYYLTGAVFILFGDSDLIARLLPAVFGAAVIPLFWIMYHERWLSKNHALFGALFFAVSPTMVYFSRFLRHDIFQIFFTVLFLVTILIYFDKGKWQYAIIAAVSAACGLCLKEDMPFTLLIVGSFLAYATVSKRMSLPATWKRDFLAGLLVMAGTGCIFYTTFFTHPEMILQAPILAIDHWMGVQGECRICGPPWYYLMLLTFYEFPLVILAILGIYSWGVQSGQEKTGKTERQTKKQNRMDKTGIIVLLALYWMVASCLLYAYIGEKVPWLLIHQLFPLILLASYGLAGKKVLAGVIAAVILLIITIHVCYAPGDLNEPIVQVQNSEELRGVMDRIAASNMSVLTTDAYWPLPWYFRGESWRKITLLAQKPDPSLILQKNPDLVILLNTNSYQSGQLPGYRKDESVYNYSFSLPLVSDRLAEWFIMRDGEKLASKLDIFSKPGPARTSFSS